jgi:gamma-glutamyl-gamma-aminobutyrate hydrolase PuuD
MTHIATPKHKIRVFPSPKLGYDELYLNVFIQGPAWEQKMFAEMFVKARCWRVDSPDEADLVVFTGGADVSPSLYDQRAHPSTTPNKSRDAADIAMWKKCFEDGIPMFGVCRGMQFLWVMQGGSLYQDVDNHNGEHFIFDREDNKSVSRVSSVHHQMIDFDSIPKTRREVIATSSKATKRVLNGTSILEGTISDCEAVFMRDTCFFGVQGHPEYRGYEEFLRWTLKKMIKFYSENPDIENVKRKDPEAPYSVWRLKEEIRENREQKTWDQYINMEGFAEQCAA